MIVTVAGFKGGVGKTTSVVHLAGYLAARGKTAVIDGDDNQSATAWAARGGLPFPILDVSHTKSASREYEHLVIDTKARPDRDDLTALARGCDFLILPTTPDALALDALGRTIAELRALKATHWRVLLCAVPPRPSHDGDEARAYLASERIPVFKSQIRRLSAFSKAALAGCLVQGVRGDPRASLGWDDYQRTGKELK